MAQFLSPNQVILYQKQSLHSRLDSADVCCFANQIGPPTIYTNISLHIFLVAHHYVDIKLMTLRVFN